MEGLEIRQATLADKQAVLAINDNVYDGLDYLETLYEEEFIKSANTTSYVAVFNGTVIGFIGVCVVDNGQTVVTRAGRVRAQYSSQGFYKTLMEHSTSKSNAAIIAFTTLNINPAISTTSFQLHHRRILVRTMSRFDFKTEDILSQPEDLAKLPSMLTQSQLLGYITTDEIKRYLFPHDRIVVNWVPFCLIQSNIQLMWKLNTYSHRVTDIRSENDVIKGLLTISTSYKGISGVLVCQMDVYGTDINSLRHHMVSHLEFLRSQEKCCITLLMFSESEVNSEIIVKICEGLGLKKIVWTASADILSVLSAQCLFEKSLTGKETV